MQCCWEKQQRLQRLSLVAALGRLALLPAAVERCGEQRTWSQKEGGSGSRTARRRMGVSLARAETALKRT